VKNNFVLLPLWEMSSKMLIFALFRFPVSVFMMIFYRSFWRHGLLGKVAQNVGRTAEPGNDDLLEIKPYII
jgi:hypothetical protein